MPPACRQVEEVARSQIALNRPRVLDLRKGLLQVGGQIRIGLEGRGRRA